MKKSIFDLMLHEQREEGELSTNIVCKSDSDFDKCIQELEKIVPSEAHSIVSDLENNLLQLLYLYEQRGYEVGVRDGVKLADDIKALDNERHSNDTHKKYYSLAGSCNI